MKKLILNNRLTLRQTSGSTLGEGYPLIRGQFTDHKKEACIEKIRQERGQEREGIKPSSRPAKRQARTCILLSNFDGPSSNRFFLC